MGHHHHHGSDHSHGSGQGHSHDHALRDRNANRLRLTLGLTLAYMIAEVTGGYLAGSLALMADAGHMLSDAAALGLSLFAAWIARRPATPQHSYGYFRAEILAALANGATLVAISLLIFIEAASRLADPRPVHGDWMMGIAAGGLVVNLAGLALLHSGRSDSLNIRGAWLHLLTDALGSVAALGAGGLIWAFGWEAADPLASILIALLVIYSSWDLLKEAIAILMESTPRHLDVDAVQQALAAGPGVLSVHDLHIWTITSGMVSLSAHVIVANDQCPQTLLRVLRKSLHDQFDLNHTTLQIETEEQLGCRTPF